MQCRHVCMRDSKYSAKRAKTTFTRFVLLVLLSSCKMLYIYNHAKNLEPSLYRCIYITHTYIYIFQKTRVVHMGLVTKTRAHTLFM